MHSPVMDIMHPPVMEMMHPPVMEMMHRPAMKMTHPPVTEICPLGVLKMNRRFREYGIKGDSSNETSINSYTSALFLRSNKIDVCFPITTPCQHTIHPRIICLISYTMGI